MMEGITLECQYRVCLKSGRKGEGFIIRVFRFVPSPLVGEGSGEGLLVLQNEVLTEKVVFIRLD